MNDRPHDKGIAGRRWGDAPDVMEEPDSDYYVRLAAKARDLAERATATGARALHLEMAAGYESRAEEAARS